MSESLPESDRVLVLAPHGRDASVAATLLSQAGIDTTVCNDLACLSRDLRLGAGVVVLTEEAVRTVDLRPVVEWIEGQPSWSDMPFVVLTSRGGGPERNPTAARLSEALGNVTFMERPLHPTTFVSVARTALKGRRRQYEARARMEEMRQTEERLRVVNETLEQRVRERTAELEHAHQVVLQQIAEREKAQEQLRQVQKMETIGQLTGGVAHDFNNLLMAIMGNLDILRRHVPDDPKLKRLIDGAMQGAKRGASLTQRLLAFARRQDLQVQAVDLAALVCGMRDLFDRSIGPDIRMQLELPDDLPPALADPNQIEMALLNLVVNARDAMPDGGAITLRLERAEPESSLALPPGSYLRLTVTDTGSGMDPHTLERAVEPFFSTKELGKGTGLGLSMIHGLAVQLKGTFRLKSELGRGTEAELWLPAAADGPRLRVDPAPEIADLEASARSTILVVDDDALIAMSTVDMLEDLGHEVIEANSGARALEILRDGRSVDLLITDHSMPGMTGLELARAVKLLQPRLPILLATGFADLPEGDQLNLPRLGKPYQQHQLAAEVSKLLRGGG